MAVAAVLLLISGCGGGGGNVSSTTTSASAPQMTTSSLSTTTTATTRLATTTSTSTTIGMASVPNVVGRNLSAARAALAAAGFKRLTVLDGTQMKRVPADGWIVYSQSPNSGKVLTSVYIVLDVLQKGERYTSPGTSPCPRLVQCISG